MDRHQLHPPPVNLNDLPDDSPQVRAAVAALRCRAVEESPEIRQSDLSDACLIRFLRCRDFDINQTWKVFKNYHKWTRGWPEITANLHPPSALSLLQTGYVGILKDRDPTGSRVIIYRIARWDPKVFTAHEIFRVSVMLSELIATEPDSQRNGVKVIFDLQGWKFAHAFQITPAVSRKIAFVLTDGFPLKLRGLHFIREPVIFYHIFNLINLLLSEKMKARIHMHGENFAPGLQKHFPVSILPEEYNGEAGPFEKFSKELTDLLMESTDYLQSISLIA